MHRARSLAAVAAVWVLAACGQDEPRSLQSPVAEEDGPHHVHGLGVDPEDGSLYIATHTGVWRAAAGSGRAQRVGKERPDVMGFTVVGAGRFVGSGHPDPQRTDLPPLLGLIESRDGGRSWTPVSLLGEADFHVLRHARGRIYGVDSTTGRLMSSRNGGRSWRRLNPPGPVIDLAVHPHDADRLVAATEQGLHASRNGGRTWRPSGRAVGLLAWPRPQELFLVDGAGDVQVSADGGRRLRRVGTIGGQPAALAHHGSELLVALSDSVVKRSADGGRTWSVRARP